MKKNKRKEEVIKGYHETMFLMEDVIYTRKPFKFEVKQKNEE